MAVVQDHAVGIQRQGEHDVAAFLQRRSDDYQMARPDVRYPWQSAVDDVASVIGAMAAQVDLLDARQVLDGVRHTSPCQQRTLRDGLQVALAGRGVRGLQDRKSTRLNSSH